MKWTLCQIKSHLGNFDNNLKKIQALCEKHKNSDLLIFPELSLTGYPPEDILEQTHILKKQQKAIARVIKSSKPSILFGAIFSKNNKLFNSAIYKNKNEVKFFHKKHLAVSDTFDEMRFFSPSEKELNILNIKNKKFLILICEDLWKIKTFPKNIDGTICINASPFFPDQIKTRFQHGQNFSQKTKAPLFYLNRVGGHDEWVFDGSSFILNEKGERVHTFPSFEESILTIDPFNLKKQPPIKRKLPLEMKKQAIQLGLKDFISQNQFKKVHLGLSGGIDSALTIALCEEALGADNIAAFFLEGPFSQKTSRALSLELAQELNIKWIEKPISSSYSFLLDQLKPLSPSAKENIQARLRSLFLMSYSNTFSSLLIGASNKSELAMGYATLYGDLSGALMPIGDLYKTEVFQMAQLFYPSKTMNKILKRKPSAELSKGQLDQHSLPPYEILDPILKSLIEKSKDPKTALEKKIFSALIKAEFKRRQSPFAIKVSSKSFGRGRRYPITLHI